MNKAFEKILERLEELNDLQIEKYTKSLRKGNLDCIYDNSDIEDTKVKTTYEIIQIVNKLAEEYNSGWIPCSERLPEEGYVLVCRENGSISVEVVGGCHWVQHLYPKFDESNIIAWQRLPEPYKE